MTNKRFLAEHFMRGCLAVWPLGMSPSLDVSILTFKAWAELCCWINPSFLLSLCSGLLLQSTESRREPQTLPFWASLFSLIREGSPHSAGMVGP